MDLSLIVVTDRRQARRPLLELVAAALDGGARTVWLREKDLPLQERFELAERLRSLGADVIAGGPDLLGGKVIHLSATDPLPSVNALGGSYVSEVRNEEVAPATISLRTSETLPGGILVGRSCHNVAQVAALTVEHYCTLSPIFESVSKPGYGPALGVGVLRDNGGKGPREGVVALGGVDTPQRAYACREAGATGVAVMGAVMRAEDPARVVKGLLA